MAQKAGAAFVEIYIQGKKQVDKTLALVQARLRAFGAAVKKMGSVLLKGLAGAGALAGGVTAGFFAMAKSAAATGDAVQKMAARTGASAEFLSQMGFAAEQSGSDMNTLGNALFRMQRRVANFTQGTGPAKRALDALGFSAAQMEGLNTEQKFAAITDKLNALEDPGLRAQYAFEIFGDQAKALLPLLESGTAGMDAMRKEADVLGRTISTEGAESAASFTDQLNRLQSMFQGLMQQVGTALLPVFTELMKELQAGISILFGNAQAGDQMGRTTESLAEVVQGMLSPVRLAMRAWYALTGIFKWGQGFVASIAAQLAGLVEMLASLPGATGMFGEAFQDSMRQVQQVAQAMREDLQRVADEKFSLSDADFNRAFGDQLDAEMEEQRAKFENLLSKPELIDTSGFDQPAREMQMAATKISEGARQMVEAVRPDSVEFGVGAFRKALENQQQQTNVILSKIYKQIGQAAVLRQV